MRSELVIASLLLLLGGCSTRGERLVPAQWALKGESGRVLEIRYAEGGCQNFDHVEKRENLSQVEIQVLLTETFSRRGGTVCTAELGIRSTEVTLDQPLGRRTLRGQCTEGDIFCADLK